jgi:hypothetical protein
VSCMWGLAQQQGNWLRVIRYWLGAFAIHKIYLQICYLLYELLIKQHYFSSFVLTNVILNGIDILNRSLFFLVECLLTFACEQDI